MGRRIAVELPEPHHLTDSATYWHTHQDKRRVLHQAGLHEPVRLQISAGVALVELALTGTEALETGLALVAAALADGAALPEPDAPAVAEPAAPARTR